MAPPVTLRTLRRFYNNHIRDHRSRGAFPRGVRAEYLALVKAYKAKVRYSTTGFIEILGDQEREFGCEHCLRWRNDQGQPVYLVRWKGDGLVSGHDNGDWTCLKCDPRLVPLITMKQLDELVS